MILLTTKKTIIQRKAQHAVQCCSFGCGKLTSTYMFHLLLSKESHVTLKIDKRLHLETVFHMATVNTMFSIRGQEELSMKSYSYKFS